MDERSIISVLRRMEKEDLDQRDQGVGRENRWRSVPKETGQFLYQMIKIAKPRKVIEIGMSHGYSTIWMGLATQTYGGKIISYEVEEWRYKKAVENIEEVQLTNTIDSKLVPIDYTNYPNNIDFVFIDAEKSDYLKHIENLEENLTKNAIIVADNTISHKQELNNYLNYIRQNKKYYSVSIPIGKGLEITRICEMNESYLKF